jgi:hypothetical protein
MGQLVRLQRRLGAGSRHRRVASQFVATGAALAWMLAGDLQGKPSLLG